jgi:hypothetical protein
MEDKDLSTVELAKKRFRTAQDFWSQSRDLSKQDILFSYGDTYNGNQYLGREGDHADREKKGLLTINIVEPACKKIVNSIRMNRPQAKVSPGDAEGSEEAAQIVEKWSRAVKSKSNADDATDCAVEMQVRGGEGYFEISIDYVDENSFTKEVIISPVRDPFCIYLDPQAVKSVDGTTAEWGFKVESVPKHEVKMRYGKDPSNWEKETDWVMEDTVMIARYVYCETEKATLYQYIDGSTGTDKDYLPVATDAEGNPMKRATYIKKWYDCILLGGEDKPVHEEEWLGGLVSFCPVWGQLYCEDGIYYLKGEVRNQIDQNRVINYVASKGVEAIAKQQGAGYTAAIESIPDVDPQKDTWKMEAEGRNPLVRLYRAYDIEGRALPQPRKEMPAQTPAAEFTAMQTFLEFAHNASGQFSAPGEIAPGASGKAVNARQQQADLSTFHYPDNLSRALRYCEQQLINIFRKMHQPGQVIRLLGIDGKEEKAQVKPELPMPYAEAANKDNEMGVKHIINPELLGSLDVVISIGPSYQTQRQEKADVVAEMVQKNPNLWQTHPDLIVQTLDLPDNQAWIERFKKTMPPELMGDEEGGEAMPPQAMMQMQQLQQQAQEMQAALQGAEQHVQELSQQNQELQMKAAQSEAKAITTQLQSKRAELSQVEQQMAAMQQPQPMEEEMEMPDDEDEIDIDHEEVLYRIEETEAKIDGLKETVNRLMVEVNKPKRSKIEVHKQPDGSYTGTKIELTE